MILQLLVAAAVSAVPTAVAPNAHDLLAGASHAIRSNRLDQATLMASRAVAAGASGPELDRVMANLAYARGQYVEASRKYEALLKIVPNDPSVLEPAAITALRLGQVDRAESILKVATSQPRITWRVWNACGVAADLKNDWKRADECYERATKLAPGELEPSNNRGWSLLLRGDWTGALALFQQAVALDPNSKRAANNLELAKAAIAADLPTRLPGESEASWAARLNDAGVAATILGDKRRAAAAFTQALNVRGIWYPRAANNLEAISSR